MDFVELTKRKHRDLYDACEKGVVQKLGRSLDRGKGLAALLRNNDAVLAPFTAEQLASLSDVHREFMRWKDAARDLRRVLAKSQISLPDGSMLDASAPHELFSLERIARMCPRASFQDHGSWAKAVQAHLELWKACVNLGLSGGSAAISMANPDHPDADEFSSSVSAKIMLEDMRGYRWLGARRGERAGILSVSIDVPVLELEDQVKARLEFLGLPAKQRGGQVVLQELVWDNLDSTIRSILDRRAEVEALRTAAAAYTGLLTAPPIQVEKVIVVHVSTTTAPAGVVVLDKTGEVIAQSEVVRDIPIAETLRRLIAEHSPDAAVLPVSSTDGDRLRECTEALFDVPIARVLPAALREARKDFPFSPMVASAVILGRRALRPTEEWTKVAPASIGLGEYSSELPHEYLTEVLDEARALAAWQLQGKKTSARGGEAQGSAVTFKRLNPLIRTIRDLKPGMSVDGVVTNLTRFGAFVNIGLSTEAMIHVSQLSTEFVDEPSQVVRMGQAVTARILEVVPEKSRIALSLKPTAPEGERTRRDSRPPTPSHGMARLNVDINKGMSSQGQKSSQSQGGGGRGDKKSRSEALADLDALFKK